MYHFLKSCFSTDLKGWSLYVPVWNNDWWGWSQGVPVLEKSLTAYWWTQPDDEVEKVSVWD